MCCFYEIAFLQKHTDTILYELALREIQNGIIDRGLMIKATSKAGGDKRKGEAIYIEWRVELLAEEAVNEAKKREQEQKKILKERKRTEALHQKKIIAEQKKIVEKQIADKQSKSKYDEGDKIILTSLCICICILLLWYGLYILRYF